MFIFLFLYDLFFGFLNGILYRRLYQLVHFTVYVVYLFYMIIFSVWLQQIRVVFLRRKLILANLSPTIEGLFCVYRTATPSSKVLPNFLSYIFNYLFNRGDIVKRKSITVCNKL